MYDTGDTFPVLSTGNRFSDDLRELAYEIWLYKADRNAARTQRMLAEECRLASEEAIDAETGEIAPLDDDSLNIPTVRQVQRWVNDGRWPEKATEDIAKMAPRLWKAANARLFAQIEAAQSFDADVLAGVYDRYDKPGILAVKEKIAARVQTLAGVGTAAGLMPVAMPQAVPEAITGEETPTQLARKQRERLRELRGGS
jgi:hypothetical protein